LPWWSADIIRKRAEHLGEVEAKDEAEAIGKAAELYGIPPARRNRIVASKLAKGEK